MSWQKVKIASPEQWCEAAKEHIEIHPRLLESVGLFINIETTSMYIFTDEKGVTYRSWIVHSSDLEWLRPLWGVDHVVERVCEHMLEMD